MAKQHKMGGYPFQRKPAQVATRPLHIFGRNLNALAKRWPDIARRVQACPDSGAYSLTPSPANLPNVLIQQSGQLYYAANPIQDAQQQIESLQLRNTRLAVFLGLGLGYEVLVYGIHFAAVQHTNHILIVEKDIELFRTALQATDLTQLFENSGVELLVGMDSELMYPALRSYFDGQSRFVFLKAMNPVYHPSSLLLYKDYYLQVLRALREAGTHQMLHFGNDPQDSLIGVENMLENLPEIIKNPGVDRLYGKFAGKPAVIVSTGPSLNKSKHLLQDIQDKALILCPDTSLKVLLDIGVRPHMVMSLERTASNAKLLQGFSRQQVADVYLAACPVVMKEAYEGYPGPRIVVYRDFDHFKWLGVDKGTLPIQKSGSNMAFKVAEALGCDPIILVGQDLAFGEDGKTHAAGTARGDGGEKLDVFQERGTLEVPGNYAEKVLTSKVWHTFLKVFEMDIANYRGTCINSTAGGAFIPGTSVVPFETAIAQHLQQPFSPLELIRQELQGFETKEMAKDLQRISALIAETIPDIEFIIQCCRTGIATWEKHRPALEAALEDQAKLNAIRKKLPKILAEINKNKDAARSMQRTFQLFLTHVFQSFHIQHEMSMVEVPAKYEDFALAQVEIALRQAEWYAVIGDLSMICLASLQKAQAKLQAEMIG